ncbi:hypothetical protein FOA52_007911 [Chlamydomonas sp. UWO 241]|nr:hypothetical protein FOA52_007911 [Chlamydomonas sp. UWO 241]
MEPVPAPTGLLIFKDITFRGFWLSGRLAKEQGPAGKAAALDRLANLIADGKLSTGPTRRFPLSRWPTRRFPLSNWQEALAYYHTDRRPAKVLLQP